MQMWREAVTCVLISVLLVPYPAGAQSFEHSRLSLFDLQTTPQPLPSQTSPTTSEATIRGLRIVPLDGQGANNIISSQTCSPPIVTLLDSNDRPVEGVEITFEAPASGPGGSFGNQQSSFRTVTDSRGQAGATNFVCNNIPGSFEIRISAKTQAHTATFSMRQVNYLTARDADKARPVPFWRNWKYWAIIGGAAAGGILAIVLTRSGDPPISVSAGPPVVGSPR